MSRGSELYVVLVCHPRVIARLFCPSVAHFPHESEKPIFSFPCPPLVSYAAQSPTMVLRRHRKLSKRKTNISMLIIHTSLLHYVRKTYTLFAPERYFWLGARSQRQLCTCCCTLYVRGHRPFRPHSPHQEIRSAFGRCFTSGVTCNNRVATSDIACKKRLQWYYFCWFYCTLRYGTNAVGSMDGIGKYFKDKLLVLSKDWSSIVFRSSVR